MLDKVSILDDLVKSNKLIICVGSGGVGKTTTSASIALHAACVGKKSIVLTIDPARRLANALGLDSIGNTESKIQEEVFKKENIDCKGNFYAMMLDTKTTFDELINKVAINQSTKDRILKNNIYKQISDSISTSQEVMAVEKLYDLYKKNIYDLIVLDTPPMKNALDFLEAPKRMSRFLDEKIINWFMKPVDQDSKGFFAKKIFFQTGSTAYKLLGYIFGQEFLLELNEFFVSFKDLTDGFKNRSEETDKILRSEKTSFLVVCSPQPSSIEDALHFSEQLIERKLPFKGVIVNQSQDIIEKPFSSEKIFSSDEEIELKKILTFFSEEEKTSFISVLEKNYNISLEKFKKESEIINYLKKKLPNDVFIKKVSKIYNDISDLKGLKHLGKLIFS